MSTPTMVSDVSIAETLATAGLQGQVLLPGDAEYVARQDSYWSNSVKGLQPAAIVQPRSAQEVSATLRALVATKTKFAIRSGGHTQFAGANNIGADGVTIDLGKLNWTRFHADPGAEKAVDIGPGARWRDVYTALQGLEGGRYVVAGGRDGNVGVAGLLLGGGKTYFTAKRGFACDDVVAYEVVLADGRIVTAEAGTETEDLFRALKGGSNNFGIVTNFRMKAFELGDIWGGLTFYPKTAMDGATRALVAFTDRVQEDVESNLLCFYTYMGCRVLTLSWQPEFKDVVIAAAFVQVAGVENAPAYNDWQQLPSIMTTCKKTTLLGIAVEYSVAPQGFYDTFATACFKNDERIVSKAAELHDQLVQELKAFIPDGNFITQCLFQPLPRVIAQRSAAAGGNMLGVEKQTANGLLLVAVGMVRTAEQEAFLQPRLRAWVQAVRDFAATLQVGDGDGNLDWIYLNYADASQDPLASYGTENVEKLRSVAAKYDPDQVFQRLCPGGFKVSKAKS
ncbi:FAD-binding domain-containing protein [Canariomyces notabilis]|uniref:FAD-binding domain-containing protein n=1 Tax=Canariomyces notabilis TaxID=2074819 RepID=A0AAN6TEY7_9PEZI|nr:FAD-binding domain-containing protein [Canariomyces arenarius]